MEIKQFKCWLIENEMDDNELFMESVKCYQVEAYKAAYHYSYLALIDYVKEIILNYRGVPKPYTEKNKNKGKDEIETSWKNRTQSLTSEDKWEEETLNFINEGSSTNVFRLSDSIRNEFIQKKDVRNTCVHNKKRKITNTSVEDLWDFIEYVKPYLVVNGSVEMIQERFEKMLYFGDKEDYEKDIEEIYNNYIKMDYISKKKLFDFIINHLKQACGFCNYDALECIDKFMQFVFDKKEAIEYDWLVDKNLIIYLWTNINSFEIKCPMIELQEYIYNNEQQVLSILIPMATEDKVCEFLCLIYNEKIKYEWWNIITMIANTWNVFNISNDLMELIISSAIIDGVFQQIEDNLYSYDTSYGYSGKSDTFDYRRFYNYRGDIYVLLYLIKNGKIINYYTQKLIEHCKNVIDLDFCIEYNKNNYRSMYNFFKEHTELYDWLKNYK